MEKCAYQIVFVRALTFDHCHLKHKMCLKHCNYDVHSFYYESILIELFIVTVERIIHNNSYV